MTPDPVRSIANEVSPLMTDVIFLMPTWKWIGLAVAITTGIVVRSLAVPFLMHLKDRFAQNQKVPHTLRYFLQGNVQKPLAWLLAAAIWHLSFEILSLNENVQKVFALIIHLLVLINLLRLAYLGVEAAGRRIQDWVDQSDGSLDSQLAPFATKVLKIVVVTLGLLLSLQSLGFNVGAVLAGLGIGSLALALAAQDTAANLFGSITILLDRPFKLGDYIKIGETEGTVEEVGFRSTVIRTPYQSLVTIPNAAVAKERIDNLGSRPCRRLNPVIVIGAQTPPALTLQFIETLKAWLRSHPLLDQNDITVTLLGFSDSGLRIQLIVFVKTRDGNVEYQVQQDIALNIMAMTAQMGIERPFPTQTLHLATLPPK